MDMSEFGKQFGAKVKEGTKDVDYGVLAKVLFLLLIAHKDKSRAKATTLNMVALYLIAMFPILVVGVWTVVIRWLF